jgi:hypothetical protein
MNLQLSVIRRGELRTHAADAGELVEYWRGGESGSIDLGSPIYRLVS